MAGPTCRACWHACHGPPACCCLPLLSPLAFCPALLCSSDVAHFLLARAWAASSPAATALVNGCCAGVGRERENQTHSRRLVCVLRCAGWVKGEEEERHTLHYTTLLLARRAWASHSQHTRPGEPTNTDDTLAALRCTLLAHGCDSTVSTGPPCQGHTQHTHGTRSLRAASPLSPSSSGPGTPPGTHAHAHAHTRTHAHAHTHTPAWQPASGQRRPDPLWGWPVVVIAVSCARLSLCHHPSITCRHAAKLELPPPRLHLRSSLFLAQETHASARRLAA